MQLYAPEPNFETILTAISTGSLLYMYPASASYSTPQNNQHLPYAYYLNHGTPTTPSNPTSYYSDTLPWQAPRVHTNTLPEFTSSTHLSQSLDTPVRGQKRKRPTNENQEPRRRLMDTPIRPLKGRELRARVQYLDDAIARLKKDIGELTRERILLAGAVSESRAYSSRTTSFPIASVLSAAISRTTSINRVKNPVLPDPVGVVASKLKPSITGHTPSNM
jgi:hypothetical protein